MKHLIVNIRGTNGSGKSHLVHQLIKKHGATPIVIEKRIWGYYLNTDPKIYIIGKYETPTGGCDTINDINDVNTLISIFSKWGHVVFEGLVATGLAGRWIDLAKSLSQHKWIFLTLDTPLKKCVERVAERRKARGQLKPMNPSHAHVMERAKKGSLLYAARKAGIDPRNYNIIAKARAVQTSHLLLAKAGLDVRRINHKRAYEYVCNLLELK